MKEEIDKGNIVFGSDETTIPSVRRNLFEKDEQLMRSVTFSYAQKASQDFTRIFDGKKVFDNPKSYLDMERLVTYLSEPGEIVLDFFAGSGTTAHGVWLANRTVATPRRFIMVQLPERLDSGVRDHKVAAGLCDALRKPRTIAEITKERLRICGKEIAGQSPMFPGDLGFRVFKLASSNIQAWEPDRANLAKTLEEAVDHLKTDRTEQDILFEVLLKLGLDLTVPIEKKTIAGKDVHSVGAGTLIVCLAEEVAADDVEPLALGIADWHRAQKPEGEVPIVFRDSAFADDVAKSNLTAILQQHGLENVRSV
jgi:adenine-specific DNA-methyltransferase